MQNLVVERVLCGFIKMNPHLVGGGTDPPVHDGGVFLLFNRLNRTYSVPPVLR